MFKIKLLVICLVIIKINLYSGCAPAQTESVSPPLYDLNHPIKIKLPEALDEISGLSYYPKDSSVFAIIDEDGLLFKIYLNGNVIKQWKFDKKRDFEDIVLKDSTFYVLVSNGDIEELRFNGEALSTVNKQISNAKKKTNEFETLYFDDTYGLVLICKDCEDDKKKVVTALNYIPDSSAYNLLYQIDVKKVKSLTGDNKLHLKPSAAAINPLTNELYILASVNRLLVVTDRKGIVKNAYPLDSDTFNQPEGITFTPEGTMIISNERGEKNNATLLIFKPQKGQH